MMDDDWEFTSPSNSNAPKTLVLVGRTGNGKSATGNSILGRKSFKSRTSSSGVTSTCELQSILHQDGKINVIDTPGLFDASVGPEFIGTEIVKCVDFAKEGIHAVLVVLSVRTRFTKEEEAAVQSLQDFFGSKIVDYMIVVFTGGDDLEDNDDTLEDYLGRECPTSLKEFLALCGNRRILFDNKTKDSKKKAEQVEELLSIVNMIMARNNGKPYSNELFEELKKGAIKFHDQQEEMISRKGCSKREISEFKQQIERSYEKQIRQITDMVESRLKETTSRLESQLAKEQAARLQAEGQAHLAQKISNDEIRKLRHNLERAQRETAELRKQAALCAIL